MKRIHAIRQQGYRLLHEGMIELSIVEANGIRIDLARMAAVKEELRSKIVAIKQEIEADEIWKVWRKRYGQKTNLASRDQLATVLFQKMGFESSSETEGGRAATDEEALQKIDHPFVKSWIQCAKYEKTLGTFLRGIEKEVVGDRLHPSFSLHTARTYRSSSDSPNFQNLPIRDKESAELIRSQFIASRNCVLVENDFKSIEVSMSACYHHDPVFISYITTPGKDMHRDMAAQLYCIRPEQVSKDARYGAKNKFVFPQFYGDYYVACARALWEWIEKAKLKGPDGKSLFKHLKKRGILHRGKCDPEISPETDSFEYHVKEVENDFWNNRFSEYGQWRRDWYQNYLKRGYFDLLTGFRVYGTFDRNAVTNYPVQGCLREGSRVLTKGGLIPIEKLVNKNVKVWTGFEWADARCIKMGIWRAAEIKLDSGIVIRCDTRHRLKNEFCEWVNFDDLKKGDFVALPKCPDPIEPSKLINWWFVFGFIVGDGCISDVKRKNLVIWGGKTKFLDIKRIYSFLKSEGYGSSYGGAHLHWNEKRKQLGVCIQSKAMADFMEDNDFKFGSTAHSKEIPEAVWMASIQGRRDFLEGLWRSDGSRVKGLEKHLHMCNRKLLLEVQLLSSSLGYDSCISKTRNGWLLRFSYRAKHKKSLRRYPKSNIQRSVKSVSRNNYSVSNEYTVDRRAFASGTDLTQYVAERILEKNTCAPEVYRFDRIKSIRVLNRSEETFTMSVDNSLHQFVADGVIHKNSAFHCLLWTLIQVNRQLRKYKMKSKVVGQIHDSLIGDIKTNELRDYLSIVEEITTVRLRKHWPWIVVPMVIEYEVAPEGGSWFQKKEVKFEKGKFFHPIRNASTTNTELFLKTLKHESD